MKEKKKYPFLRLGVGLLAAIFIIYFLIITGTAPVRKIHRLTEEAFSDSLFVVRNAPFVQDEELFILARKKAFLAAQISLAQRDSISMVINLSDSTLYLTFKGVSIHFSKISELQTDPFLFALHPLVWLRIFSGPLFVESETTSIVKEPIVVKRAPRDTIEAMSMAFMPDTMVQNPAYFSMFFPHGLNLILLQEKWVTRTDKVVERKFKTELLKRRLGDLFCSAFSLKNPCYSPIILVKIPADEVRSIYRALPEKASVVIGY